MACSGFDDQPVHEGPNFFGTPASSPRSRQGESHGQRLRDGRINVNCVVHTVAVEGIEQEWCASTIRGAMCPNAARYIRYLLVQVPRMMSQSMSLSSASCIDGMHVAVQFAGMVEFRRECR